MVKLFGFEVLKSGEVAELKKGVVDVLRQVRWMRPPIDDSKVLSGDLYKVPYYPMELRYIYDMAFFSDIIRTIITSLKFQMFRNGYRFEEKFVTKCTNESCQREFDHKAETCDTCGTITREPDASHRDEIEKRIEVVNENGQNLIEVMEMVEDDLDIMDDGFILLSKNYFFNETTKTIVGAELKEILRVNPLIIRIIADKSGRMGYDDSGNKVMVCVQHRKQIVRGELFCKECGIALKPAEYVTAYQGSGTSGGELIYYAEGEIIHVTKYTTSLLYGFSPVVTVWQKVMTLLKQDRYMLSYYTKQRPPKGLLFVNTPNESSLRKMWEWVKAEARLNPHEVVPVGVSSEKGQLATFIDFMNNLAEMQYIEAREEMRRTIGALYGVMPIFQGDTSTSGGLNNEGLQVTVTNRAVEQGQRIYNEKIFPKILKELGLNDFKLILNESEEKDEMAEIQRDIAKAQHAQIMKTMGFKVTLNEQMEFEYENPELGMSLFGVPQEGQTPEAPPNMAPTQSASPSPPAGSQQQGFSGEPESVTRGDSTVTSTTEGVDNPIYGKKKPYEYVKGRPANALKDKTETERKFKSELEKELEEMLKEYDFKRKPTNKSDLEKRVNVIVNKLSSKLLKKSGAMVKKIYQQAIEGVEKELNLNVTFGKTDENAIEMVQRSNVFSDAYKGLSERLTEKTNDIIAKAYENPEEFTIKDIVENLKETTKESEGTLTRIARTETQHISNLARANSYAQADKEGKFKFKWLNPLDNRTTDICRAITERTQKGVTKEELKSIVAEESRKGGMEPREFTPHVNCRSTFIKVV